jgi:DNA-binding MarR family transcriptional regulator
VPPAPTASPSRDLVDLASALDRVMSWLRRHSPPTELSMTARTTLNRLAVDGPARISELARHEGVTQPAMTGLVNRLETMALVRREADPADGRAALAVLTDSGRTLIEDRRRQRALVLAGQLEELPPGDQQALLAALPALERLTGKS